MAIKQRSNGYCSLRVPSALRFTDVLPFNLFDGH